MTEQFILSVDQVSFSYEKSTFVINNCSFEVKPGDRVAIRGDSGSGKTTIFRLMLGFERPDEGSIYYRDEPLNLETIRQLRKESAWLPQDLNLGSGRVEELVNFPFEFDTNRQIKPSPETVKEVFGKVGLESDLLQNDFPDLSTGQRQRVGIALCYLMQKKLILLDEPTSALDKESKKRVADLLFDDAERTVISTSHDPWWLERCDQIVELE